MRVKYISANLAYINPDDAILKVDCSAVACAVHFSQPCGNYKGTYTVKKTDSGSSAVTIYPYGGETIDGAASVTLDYQNDYKTFAPVDGGFTVIDLYTITPSFTSPVLTTPKIADGDAGVTVTSANQTHASATVTIPNCGDAADEFVLKDTAQTLTNKTLTNPTVEITVNSHNYASGTTDWTLTAAEQLKPYHKATAAGGAVNAVIPLTPAIPYVFINGSGQALTVKGASGTGIEIANGKVATVMADGTNVIRLTADA